MKIGLAQKWSSGPIFAAKNGLPGPVLVVKNGPPLPTVVLAGPNLATKTGPGDRFGSQKCSAIPVIP